MLDAPSALRLNPGYNLRQKRETWGTTVPLYGNKRPSNICSFKDLVSSLLSAGRIVTVGRLQILDSTQLNSSFLLDFQNPLASLLSPLPLPPPSSLPILSIHPWFTRHLFFPPVLAFCTLLVAHTSIT